MWNAAIRAIQNNDDLWIRENRKDFQNFFSEENLLPQGKLKASALKFHYREKLFKMFLSRDLGGLELPLHTGNRWIENASALEANWGWLLAIGVGGAYFADFMSPEISSNYFLPENALIAGSGKPSGKAIKTADGKWQIKGSWSYCSGSEQASFFTAVTKWETGNKAFILPVEKAVIRRDWNAIGLPLSCSHTIFAEDIEIPDNYFFDLAGSPGESEYPLAKYPFRLFALSCFVPVIVGISRAFWMEVREYLIEKEPLWKKFQPDRLKYLSDEQQHFLSGQSILKSEFFSLLEKSWNFLLENKEIREKELGEKGLQLAGFCFNSCSKIVPQLGMQVLDKEHLIQRFWQDLQTAYQHMVFRRY